MTAQLEIYTFGGLRFLLDGDDFKSLSTRKVEALAVYLAATRRPQPREVLADLLWDDRSQSRAMSNLRVALTNLRKHLGPFFTIMRDSVALNLDADVWLDVTELDSLLAGEGGGDEQTSRDSIERLEAGIALYQGEFLQGFSVRGARLFEEWVTVERERLHHLVMDGSSQVVDWHLIQGDYPVGIRRATRWLQLDPLNEAAHRNMMRLLAYDGQMGAAVRQYQECVRILDEELGLTPSEETTELYEQIQAGDLTVPTRPTPAVRGFELQEEIGAGSYGTIHRALQPSVNREVAVKVIRRRYANDPDFIRRFEVEAQTVAQLEHPYIVPLYDYWRDPDGAYLIMRLLRGGSLLTVLESEPWEPEAAAQMLDQVSSALALAHRQGVIHRDIKPANILFDEGGNAYLTDFGIAKVLSGKKELTAEGAVMGTLDYISPEQIKNEPVSPQTDIYSLGAVLYETLTGKKPFPDSSMANLIHNHLNESLPLVLASRPDLPVEVDQVIQRATAKRPADRYADALELATDFRCALGGIKVEDRVIEISRPAAAEIYNPYKGLRAFQEADAGDFFGREALVGELTSRLNKSSFLAVVGPSGSGKSSVVKAGLIPALRKGALAGSDKWFISEMTPGSHPLEELELALWPVAVDPPPSLVEPMQRDSRGLLRTIRRVLPAEEGAQLLLIIDQFEELFTQVENEARRGFFIDSLLTAIRDPRSPLRTVITLRADFYDRPLQYETLGRLIKESTEVVLPLTAEELTWAVREPAQRVGVGLESGLAEVIVSDVVEQPGALPLLQYALTELFERRIENNRHLGHQNGVMTREAYNDIGGVLGALGRRAEAIFSGLDRASRESTRQLFLRLVTLGEGVADTRRRVMRSELEALESSEVVEILGGRERPPVPEYHPPANDNQQTTSNPQTTIPMIIDTFGAARLLTFDHDPVTRGPTVEVAHEALLREWDRLRNWLNESREDIRQERALARAAAEWEEHDQDISYLLRGTRLEQVEAWQESTSLRLTHLEQAFVEGSLQQRGIEQEAEVARQAHEAHLEQRSRRTLRGLVAVLAIATLISSGLGVFAFQRQQDAQKSAAEAQNTALVAGSAAALTDNDTDTALALAWQAVELNPDSALAQAQLSEAAYAPGTVRQYPDFESIFADIAISPDGSKLISGARDTLMLWDVATGEIIRRFEGHTDDIWDVAFSPDGKRIASVSGDLTTIIWDVQTGEKIHILGEHTFGPSAIEYSPDGSQIITGDFGENSKLILWDAYTGEEIRRFEHDSPIVNIQFLSDGSSILFGDQGGKMIHRSLETGEVIHEMNPNPEGDLGPLGWIAISPDELTAISGFLTFGLFQWDLNTGELIRTFDLGDQGASSLVFHPDNEQVLVGGSGNFKLIDLLSGETLNTLTFQGGEVSDLLFLPNDRYVVAATNSDIRLWDLYEGQLIEQMANLNSRIMEVDLSPDGLLGLTGTGDGIVSLWNMQTGEVTYQLTDEQQIMAVTFSPNGQTALIGAGYLFGEKRESGHIILWDVKTGKEIRRFEGHPYAVIDVEFSPDGQLAISSGAGAMAILWDVETGQEIWRVDDYWADDPAPAISFWDVEFSPDGQTILATYSEGQILVLDVESGQEIGRLEGHTDGMPGVVFNQDGQIAASAGWDAQAIIWDIQSQSILHRLTNHTGPLGQVRFTPDSLNLLGGSADGTGSLWDVNSGEVIRRYKHGGFMRAPDLSPDGREALVGFQGGRVELWRIDSTLEELMDWTKSNRYIPELTCEQRELYQVEPLCGPKES